jgi:hypothetical protein
MVGAWRINRYIDRRVVLGGDPTLDEPPFQFLAADVCQHLSIYFYAWGKLLAAFLDHLQTLTRIIPNVPVLKWEAVFSQNGTDTLTPTAMRFQISNDFWFFHAHRLQRTVIRRNYAEGDCK